MPATIQAYLSLRNEASQALSQATTPDDRKYWQDKVTSMDAKIAAFNEENQVHIQGTPGYEVKTSSRGARTKESFIPAYDSGVTRGWLEQQLDGPIDFDAELGWDDRRFVGSGEGFEEKQARFNSRYPAGEMRMVTATRDPAKIQLLQSLLKEAETNGDTKNIERVKEDLADASVPIGNTNFLMVRKNPKAPWMIVNKPSLTWNDTADLMPGVPAMMGGAFGGMLTRNPWGALAGMFGGAAIGHLIPEAYETYRGWQRQGPLEVLGDAAIEGTLMAVPAGAKLSWDLGKQIFGLPKPVGQSAKNAARDLRRGAASIESMQAEGVKFPKLSTPQADQSTLAQAAGSSFNRVTGELTSQRAEVSDKLTSQIRRKAIERASVPEASAAYSRAAETTLSQQREAAKSMFPVDPTTGGQATQRGVRAWIKKSWDETSALKANESNLANKQRPIYDKTDVDRTVADLRNKIPKKIIDIPPEPSGLVDAAGNPIMGAPSKAVVQEPPQAWKDMSALIKKMQDASQEQLDYRLIREWREQASEIADFSAGSGDKTSYYAKTIRNALSKLLRNPKNASETQEFVAASRKFDEAYTKFRTIYDNPNVKFFDDRSASVEQQIAKIAENPTKNLPEQLRIVVSNGDQAEYKTMRESVQSQILGRDNGHVVQDLHKLRENDRRSWEFLFQGGEWENALEAARMLDKYVGSPASKIMNARNSIKEQFASLFERFDDPKDLRALLTNLDDPELARGSIYKYIENKAASTRMVPEGGGEPILDPKAFGRMLWDLEDRGILKEFLTPGEITQLQGIEALARTAGARPGDLAAALQLQSLVADLTHLGDPKAMWDAFTEVLWKSRTAKIYLRRHIDPKKMRQMAADLEAGKAPLNRVRSVLIGTTAAATKELYTHAGTGYGEGAQEE